MVAGDVHDIDPVLRAAIPPVSRPRISIQVWNPFGPEKRWASRPWLRIEARNDPAKVFNEVKIAKRQGNHLAALEMAFDFAKFHLAPRGVPRAPKRFGGIGEAFFAQSL